MGFCEKVTPSSCYIFLKREFDDILNGRNIENYTKPISIQLPAGKIFSEGRRQKGYNEPKDI